LIRNPTTTFLRQASNSTTTFLRQTAIFFFNNFPSSSLKQQLFFFSSSDKLRVPHLVGLLGRLDVQASSRGSTSPADVARSKPCAAFPKVDTTPTLPKRKIHKKKSSYFLSKYLFQ
jgi:hypothetical protein